MLENSRARVLSKHSKKLKSNSLYQERPSGFSFHRDRGIQHLECSQRLKDLITVMSAPDCFIALQRFHSQSEHPPSNPLYKTFLQQPPQEEHSSFWGIIMASGNQGFSTPRAPIFCYATVNLQNSSFYSTGLGLGGSQNKHKGLSKGLYHIGSRVSESIICTIF